MMIDFWEFLDSQKIHDNHDDHDDHDDHDEHHELIKSSGLDWLKKTAI